MSGPNLLQNSVTGTLTLDTMRRFLFFVALAALVVVAAAAFGATLPEGNPLRDATQEVLGHRAVKLATLPSKSDFIITFEPRLRGGFCGKQYF